MLDRIFNTCVLIHLFDLNFVTAWLDIDLPMIMLAKSIQDNDPFLFHSDPIFIMHLTTTHHSDSHLNQHAELVQELPLCLMHYMFSSVQC
jgi:hypothetical protein